MVGVGPGYQWERTHTRDIELIVGGSPECLLKKMTTDEMFKRRAGSRQAKRGREASTRRSQSKSKGMGVNEKHGADHQKLGMASK